MADRACSWRSWWIAAQSADRQGSKTDLGTERAREGRGPSPSGYAFFAFPKHAPIPWWTAFNEQRVRGDSALERMDRSDRNGAGRGDPCARSGFSRHPRPGGPKPCARRHDPGLMGLALFHPKGADARDRERRSPTAGGLFAADSGAAPHVGWKPLQVYGASPSRCSA